MTIEIGLSSEQRYTVTDEMAPPHIPVKVLGTPNMIGLIERTCLLAVQPSLETGQTTVGTHVCVSHQGAAPSGREIVVRCKLSKIEKRRLTFETEVECEGRPISKGTHERAVIDTAKFG